MAKIAKLKHERTVPSWPVKDVGREMEVSTAKKTIGVHTLLGKDWDGLSLGLISPLSQKLVEKNDKKVREIKGRPGRAGGKDADLNTAEGIEAGRASAAESIVWAQGAWKFSGEAAGGLQVAIKNDWHVVGDVVYLYGDEKAEPVRELLRPVIDHCESLMVRIQTLGAGVHGLAEAEFTPLVSEFVFGRNVPHTWAGSAEGKRETETGTTSSNDAAETSPTNP